MIKMELEMSSVLFVVCLFVSNSTSFFQKAWVDFQYP